MHRIVESLYCTPETNITECVNYIGIKMKNLIYTRKEMKKGRQNINISQLFPKTLKRINFLTHSMRSTLNHYQSDKDNT